MLVRGYLIAYNLALCLGWAYVLYLAVQSRSEFSKIWLSVELPLKIFQTAAILEVISFINISHCKIFSIILFNLLE